jgi:hypothetical protein
MTVREFLEIKDSTPKEKLWDVFKARGLIRE